MTLERVDKAVAHLLGRYTGPEVALADLICDAHATSDAVALVYEGANGRERMTFAELRDRSMRLAGALREQGVGAGDRVAMLLPKSPELVVALVAIWRAGAVNVPLFTAFGPDAVGYRVRHSGACAIITDTDNRAKLSELDAAVVMSVDRGGCDTRAGDIDFADAIAQGEPFAGVHRDGDDMLMLLYTSGTTGNPKGVEVPVRALASIHSYMVHGLDVQPSDVFWNLGDPGWAYGLWFAVTGPLLLGQTTLLRGLPFDAEAVFATMIEHGVTNFAAAPTVFRSLRASGVPDGFQRRSRLRALSSAGEPLNAELLDWSERELGVAIHDQYGQSELGMVAGFAQHPTLDRDLVAGSMGTAAPGYRVVILDDSGEEAGPLVDGELAIDVPASPLYWFCGYFDDVARTAERFLHGPRYYLTGDAARLDENGLLHFASRVDDVITSSGYRIGPFEVESALIAHGAVADVAVIGTPDELRGEAVTAFVVTAPVVVPSPELAEELRQFVKARLAKHLSPRHVVFVDALPRTASGKVQRNMLRAQWLERYVSA